MITRKRKHKTIYSIKKLGNTFFESQNILKECIENYLISNYSDYNAIGLLKYLLSINNQASNKFDWEAMQSHPTYLVVLLLLKGAEIDPLKPNFRKNMRYINIHISGYENFTQEAIDRYSKPIFTIACLIGSLKLIKFIYSQVAKPKPNDEDLQIAAKNGYFDIIEYIIQYDLPSLKKMKWDTLRQIFYLCFSDESLNTVKLFVNHKVITNKHFQNAHISPLLSASCTGNIELCKYLINEFHNSKDDYQDAVEAAARNGHLHLLEYYEGLGINVGLSDTTMKWACFSGHQNVVEYLLSKGLKFEPSDLADAINNKYFAVAQIIMDNGIDLISAVNYAAKYHWAVEVNYLIRQIIKRSPHRLIEVWEYLSEYQKTKYDYLLTTADFNLV